MKKILQKHEVRMLTHALNMDGKIVNVDDVPTGQKCLCICPACKEPLIAKNNGSVRVHHFAHQSGTECALAYESMLHRLAKERVQSAFLNTDQFFLDFEYQSYCIRNQECKFIRRDPCYTSQRRQFNLKEFYDSCEQEIEYDGIRRRSDLKIFSSTHPERSPIYIEFCVTHASEQEKLHSGNKIIECLIESEKDIEIISKWGFREDKHSDNEYNQFQQTKVQFYGFKNTDYNNTTIKSDIVALHSALYQSGKTQCYLDLCKCNDVKRSSPYTLFEVCFYSTDTFKIFQYAKYLGYDKYHIPNCRVCKNYVKSYNGLETICRLYKQLQIVRYEKFDTSRARECSCFIFNQKEHDEVMQYKEEMQFDELY